MNSNSSIIETVVIPYVKSCLQGAEGGHDWFHIERVWILSKQIALKELPNETMIVELGALLHDIADSKFHNGDEEIGPKKAAKFLLENGFTTSTINHVVDIIKNISFKGGHFTTDFNTIEFKIVQDADRLDALGAIGIARTFNYGGFKNRAIYDPSIPPNLNMDKSTYKNSNSPSINHFYEKLLLLKDRMNTTTGKIIAEERHQFMLQFLTQFQKETILNSNNNFQSI